MDIEKKMEEAKNMTVAALKKELLSLGLPASGVKSVLLQRYREALSGNAGNDKESEAIDVESKSEPAPATKAAKPAEAGTGTGNAAKQATAQQNEISASDVSQLLSADARKRRAEKFGTSVAASGADSVDAKAARLARFGVQNVDEDKKKRLERFGTADETDKIEQRKLKYGLTSVLESELGTAQSDQQGGAQRKRRGFLRPRASGKARGFNASGKRGGAVAAGSIRGGGALGKRRGGFNKRGSFGSNKRGGFGGAGRGGFGTVSRGGLGGNKRGSFRGGKRGGGRIGSFGKRGGRKNFNNNNSELSSEEQQQRANRAQRFGASL